MDDGDGDAHMRKMSIEEIMKKILRDAWESAEMDIDMFLPEADELPDLKLLGGVSPHVSRVRAQEVQEYEPTARQDGNSMSSDSMSSDSTDSDSTDSDSMSSDSMSSDSTDSEPKVLGWVDIPDVDVDDPLQGETLRIGEW